MRLIVGKYGITVHREIFAGAKFYMQICLLAIITLKKFCDLNIHAFSM